MANLEEEKLINEEPDFDSQKQIIEEEHNKSRKNKKWRVSLGFMFLFSVIIVLVLAFALKVYIPYDKSVITGKFSAPLVMDDVCLNVNLKINDSYINVTDGDNCIPVYNVDYFNNRKALFNIDVLGDKSFIFNKINQTDDNGVCIKNCDIDEDGWPDLNIDLNGDGVIDINFSDDNSVCVKNCDINFDMIPDLNIDLNDDGVLDINIDNNYDGKPDLNITYMNNKESIFNIDEDNDGKADKNIINNMSSFGTCTKNCDINGDNLPDYNIDLGSGVILNELIVTGTNKTYYNFGMISDIKCNLNKKCLYNENTFNNTYINIDVNGDGIPDINLSKDGGATTNNKVNDNNKNKLLNEDVNHDGFPDINIDLDGDKIPDLNITNKKGECIKNCDINGDGRPDMYINDVQLPIYLINIDKDYDGICDINCDIDNNYIPDLNIDTDDDSVPDLNIDIDSDGVCDAFCLSKKAAEFAKRDTNTVIYDVDTSENGDIYYVNNALKISKKSVTPGETYTYKLIINNKSNRGIKYNLKWISLSNGFDVNDNLTYEIKRDFKNYIESSFVPYEDSIIKENIYLAAKSAYIYDITLSYNGYSLDTRSFKGTIDVEINK